MLQPMLDSIMSNRSRMFYYYFCFSFGKLEYIHIGMTLGVTFYGNMRIDWTELKAYSLRHCEGEIIS